MQACSLQRQRGFSMIELLISVVIMSIGVLGMVGLQMIAMQQNRSAMMQGEATLLANDIFDRMRANPGTTYSSDLEDAFTTTTAKFRGRLRTSYSGSGFTTSCRSASSA